MAIIMLHAEGTEASTHSICPHPYFNMADNKNLARLLPIIPYDKYLAPEEGGHSVPKRPTLL